MTEMKWATIKRKAQAEFTNRMHVACLTPGEASDAAFLALVAQVQEYSAPGKARPASKILEEWHEYGLRLIEDWDVRCVGKLIERFPSCVPTNWKGRKLQCWIADNANCDWMVAPVMERGA